MLAALTGCASAPPRSNVATAPRSNARGAVSSEDLAPSATGTESPKELAALGEIKTAFSKAQWDQVIAKASAFAKRYPKGASLAQAYNYQGLALLLSRRAPLSIDLFRKSIEAGASSPVFVQYVSYNLAKAEYESGKFADATRTLGEVRAESMDRDNRLKVHYLRASLNLKNGAPIEAAREALAASRLIADLSAPKASEDGKEARSGFVALLEQALDEIKAPETIATLYREFEDSPIADSLLIRVGAREIEAGNRERGTDLLRTLMKRFPDSAHYARAAELARAHETVASGPVAPGVIGVLLPMKGKFAKFGERSLKGIELALGIFGSQGGAEHSGHTIVIEDSGDEPEQTIKALNRLVTQHHVVAVIGPLASKGIDKITDRARVLGVPLISLARYSGMPSEWVFQAGLTLRMQAEEMARFAIDQMGLKRFAILTPKDKVGEEAGSLFWDAVQAQGGEIRGYESYRPDETDFRVPVDKLSGLYYPESRNREQVALARQRTELKITKRTRKTEQYFALKPIVDYDAVFIPDEAKVTGQILPTFAYRDVDKVVFLGTAAWNTPELPSRAQGSAENAVFVDAFYAASELPASKRYSETYREAFDEEPTVIDALSYDAAKVLERALSKGGASREEAREQLAATSGFNGATGKISYRDGQLARSLQALTVRGGRIVPWSPKAGK